jgi:hypothetical protein
MKRFLLAVLLVFPCCKLAHAQADRLDRIDAKLTTIEAKLDKLIAGMQSPQVNQVSVPAVVRLPDGSTFTGPTMNCANGSCAVPVQPMTYSQSVMYTSSGGCGAASAGGGGLFSRLRARRGAGGCQ